jgi:hypothetical protein
MSDDDDSIPPEEDVADEGELDELKDEANMVRQQQRGRSKTRKKPDFFCFVSRWRN